MDKCYFVSVGTSLVLKYNKQPDIKPNNINLEDQEFRAATDHEGAIKSNPTYKCYFNSITLYLAHMSIGKLKEASAELSTLLQWKDKSDKYASFTDLDRIILISTTTAEGILCANILKWVFEKHWDKIKDASVQGGFPQDLIKIYDNIDGLGKADDPDFQKKGLPNFLNLLHQKITEYKNKGYEVILIPTGGYKALIPYMVLVGILHGLPVRYVYEESTQVLELPKVPLGLDIERWTREKFRLLSLLGKQYNLQAAQYKKLDPDFRNLLEEDIAKKFSLSALAIFFEAAYRDLFWKTPLQLMSGKTHLLDYLNGDLKKKFGKLVNIGHLIWKGDRVPEMVDHSLKHHYDLFDLAERFLLPIFDNNPDFLKPEEIFILLCALYLHDCGHTLGTVIDKNSVEIFLSPTEIREYHHILGYERLKNYFNPTYVSKALYEALNWDSNPEETWKNYMEIIATVGLFHRKKMPLHGRAEAYKECQFFVEEYFPLLKEGAWCLSFNREMIGPERVALLVCLLRIIDSLDSQRARSGDPLEVDFHLAQISAEAEEEKSRFKILEGFIKEKLNDKFSSLDYAIKETIRGYRQRESKHVSNQEPPGSTPWTSAQLREFLPNLKNQSRYDDATEKLLFEYVLSRLRADFKEFQKQHYTDHAFVKNIVVDARRGDKIGSNGEKWGTIITIDIKVEEDTAFLGKLGLTPEDVKKKRSELLGDMEREYAREENLKDNGKATPVRDILLGNGITVNYGIHDES